MCLPGVRVSTSHNTSFYFQKALFFLFGFISFYPFSSLRAGDVCPHFTSKKIKDKECVPWLSNSDAWRCICLNYVKYFPFLAFLLLLPRVFQGWNHSSPWCFLVWAQPQLSNLSFPQNWGSQVLCRRDPKSMTLASFFPFGFHEVENLTHGQASVRTG